MGQKKKDEIAISVQPEVTLQDFEIGRAHV